jgi:hypothetical protein
MDLPNAMNAKTLAEGLGLDKMRNRRWHVQPACAVQGDGLFEGLDWMCTAIKQGRKK